MAAQPLVVTPELLLTAWRQRRRADWPASYDDCMADPRLRGLVRAQALGLAQAARSRATRAAVLAGTQAATQAATTPAAPARPAPLPRTAPPRPAQGRLFDPKRLAAGDRTDDDD